MKALVLGGGYLFLFLGVGFSFAAVVGLLRFPDVYARLHAGTKALTGGGLCTLAGVALLAPTREEVLKILLIALFLVFTNPLASHAIARACYRRGVVPRGLVRDDCARDREGGGPR